MLKMQDLSHLACGFGREVLTDHPTLGYSLYVFKGEARAELFSSSCREITRRT